MGVMDRRRELRQAQGATLNQRVSILIAARNYAQFLGEAIESALNQTIPCEVIYSDDASDDDSVEVAQSFADRGVVILTASERGGACVARNRAAAVSTGDYLVHLDGDDIMPPDFVAKHLEAMAPGVPFVYGPAQAFGTFRTLWQVPPWDKYDLWSQNTVNTSAMYRRSVFEAVGGWRDGPGSMWDWDLAIRASRLGMPLPSRAVLQYRQHDGSFSRTAERSIGREPYQKTIRRDNAKLSIVSILSGRLPGLFEPWFERVWEATKWLRLPAEPEIVLLNNSRDSRFSRVVQAVAGTRATVVPYPVRYEYATERQRRDAVAAFMAGACNRALECVSGDLVWIVEDDVLVPPVACAALHSEITKGTPPHAVTGLYRSRHGNGHIIAGWHKGGRWEEMQAPPDNPMRVDFCGTGCLMFWRNRPLIPRRFLSHVHGVPAHDWAWGMELTSAGGELLAVPAVRCGHAADVNDVIPV